MTQVDLIVSTYNHPELLEACLSSLQASTFNDYRLFVVDDHSTAPVLGLVRRYDPRAVVIRSKKNMGLVRCLNAAIRAGSSPLVAILNDDTEVEPDWLGQLVQAAERHPDAGSIASKMRLMSDRNKLHSAGDFMTVTGIAGSRGVWLDDVGQYDTEEEIFAGCGGAILYRRSAIEAVAIDARHVFDPSLFMYCEDVDLAWRLQRAGFPCWYAPRAIVYHHLSATAGGSLASYYVHRNLWLVLARRMPISMLKERKIRILARHLARGVAQLRYIKQPAARAALRGYVVGLFRGLVDLARRPADPPLDHERIDQLLLDFERPISETATKTGIGGR